MSRELALILCYGFILALFRLDLRWRSAGTRALLIPGAWLAVTGSRPVSYWFGGGGGSDANPIDTLVFAVLIGSALVVMSRRGLDWGALIRQNKPLFLLYLYLLISVLWSEIPLTSVKRLFKDFGCILVGLVLLTEEDPEQAVRAVYVRVAYILFPLSVIFIKFFPEIGRTFTRVGEPMYGGITTQKNSLGETVFVFGIMVLWDLFEIYGGERRRGRTVQMLVRGGLLAMGLWLLVKCDSQTSFLCLVVGGALLWGAGRLLRMPNGKRVLISGLVAAIVLMAMDQTFGLREMVIRALGRDPSLTGRTDIWHIVLQQNTDPVIGSGFYSFWNSAKGKAVIDSFMLVNEAHNGYLEMYLDGGLIGNVLLAVVLLATGGRVINRLFQGGPLGRIGLIFWLLPILYNFSETSYFRLDVLWFTFLLVAVNYARQSEPQLQPEPQFA